jgi:uncharacterized phage protein gp47/JayE
MTIFVKDPNEILAEARTRLIENTEITNVDPGGTARAILEVVAASQGDQYADLSFNINQAFVSKALGENLDLIGVLLNVKRGEMKRAQDTTFKNFRFYIDPATQFTGSDIAGIINSWLNRQVRDSVYVTSDTFTIPAGTTINNRGGAPYTTLEDAVFGAGDTVVFVPVQATALGSIGNAGPASLNSHNLAEEHNEFTSVANIILADNLLPISSGKDIEDDDSFRFRIINEALASRHANLTAVRLSALSVPGVSDVNIQNFSHGVGTFAAFVISRDPIVSTGTLNAVQAAVSQTAAAGIRATVQSPIYRGIEMTISLEFFPDVGQVQRDEIKAAVRRSVVDYTNNIEMGSGFVVNRVVQTILDVSNSIKDTALVNMFIGEYNSSTATNERRFPVFVTNQNLFWDEKFYTNAGMLTVC